MAEEGKLTTVLNNGMTVPLIGIGTYVLTPDEAEHSVTVALRCGLRLIDTANVYMNERGVGRGIKASGVARDQIVLGTKLWPSEYRYADAKRAIDETLLRLGTDYLDYLLLHQQFGDYMGAYEAMQDAVDAGKVRAIGLSNFGAERFTEVAQAARVKPAIHQVETHPFYQEGALEGLGKEYGTVIESWFPLGGTANNSDLLTNEVLEGIAAKHGRSVAQVTLRWHVQKGFIAIPGSKSDAHIVEDADIEGFALDDDDMDAIARLDGTGSRFFTMSEEEQERNFLSFAPDFNVQK